MIKLSREDAIELFLRIIAKYEGYAFDDCCNTDFILNRLTKYKSEKKFKHITYDVFYKNKEGDPYADKKKFLATAKAILKHGSKFYNFQERIKENGIITLQEDAFEFFHDYIGGIDFIDAPVNSEQDEISKFANRLLDHFPSSTWNIYIPDAFKINYALKEKPGISKCILRFKSYGKAELIRINPESNNQEILYKGTCRVKGDRLAVELFSILNSKDYLDLTITVPQTSTVDWCLGFAVDVKNSSAAKKCVIERTKITSKPFFSCFDIPHKRDKEIPATVRKYLTETVGILELSNTIVSSKQLEAYLNQAQSRNIQIKEIDILKVLALISLTRCEPTSTSQKFLSTKNTNIEERPVNKKISDHKTIYLSGMPQESVASIKENNNVLREYRAEDFYHLIGTPLSREEMERINAKQREAAQRQIITKSLNFLVGGTPLSNDELEMWDFLCDKKPSRITRIINEFKYGIENNLPDIYVLKIHKLRAKRMKLAVSA